MGANGRDEAVVMDGNWVTSRKPEDGEEFSSAILEALKHKLSLPRGGYGVMRSIIRAKGMVSLTWWSPHIHPTVRSTPRPKPAWGTLP
jgi:hypothetical protein